MKKWLGCIAILMLAITASPVYALGIGINEQTVVVACDSHGEATYTVIGNYQSIYATLEDMPFVIQPATIEVIDGKATVKIYANGDIDTGIYEGKILFTESEQIGAGVRQSVIVDYNGCQSSVDLEVDVKKHKYHKSGTPLTHTATTTDNVTSSTDNTTATDTQPYIPSDTTTYTDDSEAPFISISDTVTPTTPSSSKPSGFSLWNLFTGLAVICGVYLLWQVFKKPKKGVN